MAVDCGRTLFVVIQKCTNIQKCMYASHTLDKQQLNLTLSCWRAFYTQTKAHIHKCHIHTCIRICVSLRVCVCGVALYLRQKHFVTTNFTVTNSNIQINMRTHSHIYKSTWYWAKHRNACQSNKRNLAATQTPSSLTLKSWRKWWLGRLWKHGDESNKAKTHTNTHTRTYVARKLWSAYDEVRWSTIGTHEMPQNKIRNSPLNVENIEMLKV